MLFAKLYPFTSAGHHTTLKELDNEGQDAAYAIGSPVALILGLISKPVITFKSLLGWCDVHDS